MVEQMDKTDSICNASFYKEQIDKSFSRITLVDDSMNLMQTKVEIEKYYEKKYADYNSDGFSYDFIDLFCGAGGLSTGLEHEGFKPIMALDKDEASLLTYRFNRPWIRKEMIIQRDIRELVNEKVFPHVPLIVGGPPCQGFSVANKHKKENDERNELYKFYVHAVEQSQPDLFLMENVEGILSVFDAIKDDFEKIGYIACNPLLLSPKEFGFPQSRRRAFILGINKRHSKDIDALVNDFTSTIDSFKIGVKYTLWDAISDLPPVEAKTLKNSTYLESKRWGYTFAGLRESETDYVRLINDSLGKEVPLLNHRSKYNNSRDIQIFQTLKPGEKSDAESIQEINPYKNRADIFRDKFDKLIAEEPCKAITAHMYYDCNMYIHPYQARGLTPREAARVQGFPDDYLFLGSPNEWYRQIGNAVSPLMARVLGKALNIVLQRINT